MRTSRPLDRRRYDRLQAGCGRAGSRSWHVGGVERDSAVSGIFAFHVRASRLRFAHRLIGLRGQQRNCRPVRTEHSPCRRVRGLQSQTTPQVHPPSLTIFNALSESTPSVRGRSRDLLLWGTASRVLVNRDRHRPVWGSPRKEVTMRRESFLRTASVKQSLIRTTVLGTVALLLLEGAAQGQTAVLTQTTWGGFGNEVSSSVAVAVDGSTYITGTTDSFTTDQFGNPSASIFLVK